MAENHTLTAGIEINSEKLKHYMFKDTANNHVENYVAYVQYEWNILDNLTAVGGARADYHSEYDLHVTPKVSVMYKPGIFTFRGNFATGFCSPSLKEIHAEWDHQGMFTMVGNPDLKPEKSNHFSVSAEITTGILNASVSGYYNRLRDKITQTFQQNEGRSEMVYVNASKARTTGMDAIVQLKFDWGLTWRGSYAYIDDHQETDGYNISSIRPHSITFNTDYSCKFGKVITSIGMNGRWMSSVRAWEQNTNDETYNLIKYSSRTICSAHASAQFPRGIRLTTGIDNLFNFKDKNISNDTSISPEQGISFVARLSINIADLFKL